MAELAKEIRRARDLTISLSTIAIELEQEGYPEHAFQIVLIIENIWRSLARSRTTDGEECEGMLTDG